MIEGFIGGIIGFLGGLVGAWAFFTNQKLKENERSIDTRVALAVEDKLMRQSSAANARQARAEQGENRKMMAKALVGALPEIVGSMPELAQFKDKAEMLASTGFAEPLLEKKLREVGL